MRAHELDIVNKELRDWRKQLKKEARVDLHVKLFLNSTNAPYYRSLSRVQSFVSYPATSTQEVFYIHYVKTPNSDDVGEWWLGQRPEEAHGFMYFPTNSLNPLELKPRSETECWLYYDEHRGSFLADSTAHIEQVSFGRSKYSSSTETPDCTDDIILLVWSVRGVASMSGGVRKIPSNTRHGMG